MGRRRRVRIPGKPLFEQEAEFNTTLLDWKGNELIILKKSDLQRLKQLMTDIGRTNNIRQLQERLVIWNVNEFMVKEKPTHEDFWKIVEFKSSWLRRFLHWVQNSEEKETYITQINCMIDLAFKRFYVLSDKKRLTER